MTLEWSHIVLVVMVVAVAMFQPEVEPLPCVVLLDFCREEGIYFSCSYESPRIFEEILGTVVLFGIFWMRSAAGLKIISTATCFNPWNIIVIFIRRDRQNYLAHFLAGK